MSAADVPAGPDRADRPYPLVVQDGPSRLVLRHRDEGITLTPTGLEWTKDGTDRHAAYADIAAIQLQIGQLPKGGPFGSCRITFRDGGQMTVSSVTRFGNASRERAIVYAAFLRDLHGRLGAEDRTRIHFGAGNSAGRQTFGKVLLVVAALFFIGLPVVLLVLTGELKSLFITLAGAFFVYPLFRTIQRNAPVDYAPDAVPDTFFP